VPYVLWVTAFNTSFLLGYLLLDAYFNQSTTSSGHSARAKRSRRGKSIDTFVSTRVDSEDYEVDTSSRSLAQATSSTTSSVSRSLALNPNLDGSPLLDSVRSTTSGTARSRVAKRVYSLQPERVDVEVKRRAADGSSPQLPSQSTPRRAPELLEALNKNGLAVFLLVSSRFSLSLSLSLSLHFPFGPSLSISHKSIHFSPTHRLSFFTFESF
jgi:phosphatidylinositol glycan class W